MYAILGATGNTGHAIATALLAAGKKVRAVVRNPDKAADLQQKGAELAVGQVDDAAFLTKAFEGAKAAYILIPPKLDVPDLAAYQDKMGEAQVRALREARVEYAVHLSSMGAHTPVGTGPVAGLFRQERRLNRLPSTHVLHLRPTFFLENFLANIPMIQHQGINGNAMRGDLSMNFIAVGDIGAYAAKRLLALDFAGKDVQELIGSRDATPTEITRLLGEAIGKPDLPWVQFPYEDFAQALQGFGISASMANSYAEMMRYFNSGAANVIPRDAQNTTPTSPEQWVKTVFAPAYQAATGG